MTSRLRLAALFLVGSALLLLVISPGLAKGYGPVRTEVKVVGPYEIEAGGLMRLPSGPQEISFPEPVWVVGYRTEIRDAEDVVLRDDFHCHTQLKTYFTDEWSKYSRDGAPFKGVFSDGYTTELRLPSGFGVYFEAGETIVMFPAFNNRSDRRLNAKMQIEIDYIADKDLSRPLEPLFATVVAVKQPHLYMVRPGIDERTIDLRFQYPGRIHFMAVHIHPYGESIELYNKTDGKSVWKAAGKRDGDGPLISMPTYDNKKGYAFDPEQEYMIRVRYNNSTDRIQDAMAGLFILFASADGKLPSPSEPPPDEAPHDHVH
jgi:hypothetical protein